MFFCGRAVIEEHVALDEYRRDQYAEREPREGDVLGVQYLFNGRQKQFEPHQDNDHRNDKPRNVFEPAVPIRVLGIGLLPRELETYQRDNGAARVGKVIESIRGNSDRSGDRAG